MSVACELATGGTNATSLTKTSEDDSVVLFCRFVGLKPLGAGFEGED